MKIPEPILRKLQEAIIPFDTIARREVYKAGDFLRADRVIDINVRYRWDLYYDAMKHADQDLKDAMSQYLDAHIDTALRRLIEPLGNKAVTA
jgi:hypothetical protein